MRLLSFISLLACGLSLMCTVVFPTVSLIGLGFFIVFIATSCHERFLDNDTENTLELLNRYDKKFNVELE